MSAPSSLATGAGDVESPKNDSTVPDDPMGTFCRSRWTSQRSMARMPPGATCCSSSASSAPRRNGRQCGTAITVAGLGRGLEHLTKLRLER